MDTVAALHIVLDVQLPAAMEELTRAREQAAMAAEDMQIQCSRMISRATGMSHNLIDHQENVIEGLRRQLMVERAQRRVRRRTG